MRAYLVRIGVIGPKEPFSIPAVFQNCLIDFIYFFKSIVCFFVHVNEFT